MGKKMLREVWETERTCKLGSQRFDFMTHAASHIQFHCTSKKPGDSLVQVTDAVEEPENIKMCFAEVSFEGFYAHPNSGLPHVRAGNKEARRTLTWPAELCAQNCRLG